MYDTRIELELACIYICCLIYTNLPLIKTSKALTYSRPVAALSTPFSLVITFIQDCITIWSYEKVSLMTCIVLYQEYFWMRVYLHCCLYSHFFVPIQHNVSRFHQLLFMYAHIAIDLKSCGLSLWCYIVYLWSLPWIWTSKSANAKCYM